MQKTYAIAITLLALSSYPAIAEETRITISECKQLIAPQIQLGNKKSLQQVKGQAFRVPSGAWEQKPATSKQINFIMSLSRKLKMAYPDLNDLDRGTASNLIDTLKNKMKR